MEHPVNDDPVEFVLISDLQVSRVIGNPFRRDKKISGNQGESFVGESDDVRQGIMIQELNVHLVQVLVSAKNIIDGPCLAFLPLNNGFNPLP